MQTKRRRTALLPILIFTIVTIWSAGPTSAQVEIERRRPAPVSGEIDIESGFGSITVIGWDQKEVLVQGVLAAGVEDFEFDSDAERASINVNVPDSWFHGSSDESAFGSTLKIHVPQGSRLSVDSINAQVEVRNVLGSVSVTTINGAVTIAGGGRTSGEGIEVDTMTGRVVVQDAGSGANIESISGSVRLQGVSGEVEVETVSGEIDVSGGSVSSLQITSTTGAVTFRGSLAATGDAEIETFSGPVTMTLPSDVRAQFELTSFGGRITSDFGSGTPASGDRFEPFRRLRFTTGADDFEVQINTHDSDISLVAEN